MVCFSLFSSCKTKSHAISRRILTELQKSELVIKSPFLNLCICLMTCTPQSHLRKRKEKQNNLLNGCLIIPQKKNINVSYVFILTHYLGSESKEPNQWRIGRHLSLCHTVWRTFDKIQPNLFWKRLINIEEKKKTKKKGKQKAESIPLFWHS